MALSPWAYERRGDFTFRTAQNKLGEWLAQATRGSFKSDCPVEAGFHGDVWFEIASTREAALKVVASEVFS